LRFFQKITTGGGNSNAVIMGRKTFDSLPVKPLPNRANIVITTKLGIKLPENVICVNSFESALCQAGFFDSVFVIGGESIYKEAIRSPLCSKIYLTEVQTENMVFDTFFPEIPDKDFVLSCSSIWFQKGRFPFRFKEYVKV
jgi:dihydrofolate reductase